MAFALCLTGANQISKAQESPAPDATTQSPVAPPPDILDGSPLSEVIKLTQAGVDESVIASYVANSGSTFNLDSDKIIYLTDIGVPSDLVTAMIQRDSVLQQQIATAVASQQTEQAAQPDETAPATDYSTDVEPQPAVTVTYFYGSLAPYGSWTQVPGYGRCWRPTITLYDTSWQPYCDSGHWAYTDCGWYWASDYSWGATFHYGRWFRDENLGWCWTPDTVWAPAWVCWRYSDDYCGWAPLPPGATYQSGAGFLYHGRNVNADFGFGLGANSFVFVLTKNFSDSHPKRFRAAPSQVAEVFNHTTVINNFNSNNRVIVNNGIPLQRIAAATHTEIHPVAVHEIARTIRQNRAANSTVSVGMQHDTPLDANGNSSHTIRTYNIGNGNSQLDWPPQNRAEQQPEQNQPRRDLENHNPQTQHDAPAQNQNSQSGGNQSAPAPQQPQKQKNQN